MEKQIGRPKKWNTPEELQAKIDAFFDYCKKENEHPIVEGLCIFLNCDKQTILNYEEKDGFDSVIEKAKLRIANHVMGRAMKGEINPTIAIWVSKNHYGYKDKTEIDTNQKIETKTEDKTIEKLDDILAACKKLNDQTN